jgi:hypothetical protein
MDGVYLADLSGAIYLNLSDLSGLSGLIDLLVYLEC